MFEDDGLQAVSYALAAVGAILQEGVDVAPLDDVDAAPLALEELAHGAEEEGIGLVLEAVDLPHLLEDVPQVAALAEAGGRPLDLDAPQAGFVGEADRRLGGVFGG